MKVIKFTVIFIFLFSISIFAQESNSAFVAKGDSAFKVLNNDKALECYLKAFESNSDDYEAAWKISRAYVDIGEKLEGDERASHFKKGEEFAKKAVELKPEGSYGHLYLSIAIGKVALDAGKKEQVRLSKEVKKELDIAIKYDPENDIAYHVLGRWNRKMANLGWIQRKFADLFLGGIPKDASNENAIASFKKAIEFVKDTLDFKKVFCLIDEFDPHEPWDPPQQYLDLYVEKGYTGIKMITPAYMESVDYLTKEELNFMRASYAGEVSLCDNWFGYFVNELKELEIYDDSLIIFISDHGHSIGEHNATGKLPMFMYPELVDLPFMIKPPGGINGPKKIKKPYVYNFDILPTIFGFLNKDKPKAFEGIDLSIFVDEEDQNLDGRSYITCGFDVCTLYKDDNYAFITSNNRKHQKLYGLKDDPEWNKNIANDNPDICDDAFEKIKLDAKGDLPLVSRFEFESLKDWYLQRSTFSDKS